MQGGPRRLGIRPKPRGGFAARMLLGAPPPDPRQIPLLAPAPRPPDERGLGRSPNGVWGRAPTGSGAELWGLSPQ